MQVTTTRYTPSAKRFSWSFSKLDKYELCPKRHYHLDIAKDIVEPESEALKHGNTVHKVLAAYVEHGTALPPLLEPELKPAAERVFQFKGVDVRTKGAKVEVEKQYAITEAFGPTEWFGKDAWYRGIGDVMWFLGPAAFIGDYKTGRIKEDSVQLTLMAACIFAHYPEIQFVRSCFIWLKEGCETTLDIRRDDMPAFWAGLMPRVAAYKHACETVTFPPRPGGLCRKWCPVKSCPHNGE